MSLSVLLIGCGSVTKPTTLEELPSWVSAPPPLCAVASAQAEPSRSAGKLAATALGRDQLAKNVHLEVENLIKSEGDQGDGPALMEQLSRHSVSAELTGTRVEREHLVRASRELFVLVCVGEREVSAALERALEARAPSFTRAPSSPPPPSAKAKERLRLNAREALLKMEAEFKALD